MNLHNSIAIFGLFIIFLGLGLLIYASLLGLILRFHLQLFPKIHSKLDQLCITRDDITEDKP